MTLEKSDHMTVATILAGALQRHGVNILFGQG